MRKRGFLSLPFLSLLLVLVAVGFAQQRLIRKIVILGNERISKEMILHEIKSKVEGPFSKDRVREDVKAIYRLGYFRDVQVDVSETKEGVILTFVVIEKPLIEDVVISGNLKLDRESIEEVIEVKRDSILDMGKVRSSAKEIKKLYTSKGYYGSEVDYRVEFIKGNKAVVYFEISEGVKGYIKKIKFVGNKAFSSRRLKRIMKTREKGWFWWLTKSGRLEMDVLEVDINRIKGFYLDHGYVMVKVSEPEITLSKDRKSIIITIKIEEGDQYRLGSLDIRGDILTTKEELLKGLKSRVGKLYRSSLVHKDLLWLSDRYADEGYAYVDISPMTRIEHEKRLVHLVFKIQKGVKVYIGRIEIKGNTKTRDKVIRRELKVAEGDLYSSTLLRKSRQRVKRTGYFKEVDFATTPTEKREIIDLDIRVEEAEQGALQFGAGYSSLYGVVGTVSLSHRNLFGFGYKAYAKATVGEDIMDFSLGFTDPRFLDTQFSVGFDAFNETYDYTTYDSRKTGGDLKIGREITDNIRADLAYLYERVKIYNIEEEASDYIKSQLGTTTTSKVTLTVTRNTINDIFNPSRGSEIWVSGSIAGLGGDNYFYKAASGISWFHPIVGDLVLNLRGSIGIVRGYNGREVPLVEKLYVGGIRTLRGFEYGMAGPVDEENEPIGALNMLTFSSELIYPLSKALGLKIAIFYDVGKGFDHWDEITPLRHAVGVGIRWYSPLGPIRIDWGYNLDRKPERGEKVSVWDFSMGMMY
ncbi:MAG: outer membrane protein assembly factor BamA [Deltaproteobacteria bacterium]|nr:MAG: outer membrane protein assembly factor BamA [Deltaproteobacteria bacterium]